MKGLWDMSVKRAIGLVALLALSGCSTQPQAPLVNFDRVELGNPTQSESVSAPAADGFVVDSAASIHIDDQFGDGKSVAIEELRVGRSGTFLVIYDGSGLVIATQMVSPQSQPVNIPLDKNLDQTQKLQAALYLDNGDSVFDLKTDTPIIDANGALVHGDFEYKMGSATASTEESHSDGEENDD